MFIILLLIFVISIPKASNSLKIKYNKKPLPMSEKELKRIQTAEEKAIKQAEKEKQQIEKTKQKKQQAEADKMFLESQLDRYTEMLNKADKELSEIETKIKIDYELRSYQKAAKEEKRKEQIIKHIITLESKVHAIETKLAKANYIIKAG